MLACSGAPAQGALGRARRERGRVCPRRWRTRAGPRLTGRRRAAGLGRPIRATEGKRGGQCSSGSAEVGGGRCLWVLATCRTRVQGQPRQRCSPRGPHSSSPGLASADSGGQAVPRPLPQPRSGACAGPPSRAELRRGQGGARAVRLERWRRRLISHLMGEASPCFLQAPVGLSPTGLCRGRSHSSTTRATKPSATKPSATEPSATEPSATKPSVCRRGCGWPLCVCAPHKLSV